jgi:drug/metabolite transporter (DMT)-like permease
LWRTIRRMVFCLASAAAFGAMAVFGKLAYAAGATVGTLLVLRFALAAGLLWGLGAGRGLHRRDIVPGLALGAAYALQAGAYFAALTRLDAGLLSLLIYTSPAIVTGAAIALGRERADRTRLAALALSACGLILVVGGAGRLDPLGTALAVAAGALYSAYILVSEDAAKRAGPRGLTALVCTGAAAALLLGTTALGQFHPAALSAAAWLWIAALAAVSTVAAISLFLAGLIRVGPGSAAILSTLEPVTTVALAFLVFGEVLRPTQLGGGALVLAAAVALALAPHRHR